VEIRASLIWQGATRSAGSAQGGTVSIEGIISALIIGAVIGALGRLVVPGKQDIPIWLTIVIGVVAALIGSFIVGPMRDTNGVDWVELLVQVVLAAVGVALVTGARGRRGLTR
jgi:uncharacterized membrane protein YeaQ/YmgE (transglycosylase-associated protein family)